ncbi:MAG: hypothetical protein ACI3XD_03810 [Oscillospiraceae bacterium]
MQRRCIRINTDNFYRSPSEWWDAIKQFFWRLFAPNAYASLYARYQNLRNNMDDREEEMRCDLVDTENKLRRVKAELQRTKDENQELRQRVEELTAKLEAQAAK